MQASPYWSPKGIRTKDLQAEHQNSAAIRSGEYRPKRTLPGLFAWVPVFSFSRINPETNGKIRPQPDRENSFYKASGGADATGIKPSLGRKLLILLRRIAGSNVTCCKRDGHRCDEMQGQK